VASLSEFDAYVAGQWDGLCRFAYLVTGNLADAEDAVQDALVKVWPRWAKICDKGDPGAYLRRCIVNARVSAWRKNRRQVLYADMATFLGTDGSHDEAVVDAVALAQLLQSLNARQRAVIILRFLEDLSYADIAQICQCTQAAARSLVRHALAQLRDVSRREAL
jgi:RNA polymerase sigma-70 factor (sigma-E family)